MPLSDTKLRGVKPGAKPQKLSDGGQLYLLVNPSGSKLWRMDYAFAGKRKTLSFGAYPKVKLADARLLRDRAKKALVAGLDPSKHRDIGRTDHDTFEAVARTWLKSQVPNLASNYGPRLFNAFERDVFPKIGHRPIAEIEPNEILDVLRAVEERGALETAKRLRQRISAVFRYAIPGGLVKHDPAANLRDAMKRQPRVKHMASLKAGEMPEFFKRLRGYDGEPQTTLALELTIHTMTRTNEVRFGRWSEIDGNVWRIPGERMKKGRDHVIPLTRQVKAILAKLKDLSGDCDWIAPSAMGRPMSENTMLFAIYRIGYHSRATTHGFRSTASTVLNESGLWRVDAIERQLAHVPDDQVRAAYNAAQYLEERTRMLEWWSNKLDEWERIGLGVSSEPSAPSSNTDLSDLLGYDYLLG